MQPITAKTIPGTEGTVRGTREVYTNDIACVLPKAKKAILLYLKGEIATAVENETDELVSKVVTDKIGHKTALHKLEFHEKKSSPLVPCKQSYKNKPNKKGSR